MKKLAFQEFQISLIKKSMVSMVKLSKLIAIQEMFLLLNKKNESPNEGCGAIRFFYLKG